MTKESFYETFFSLVRLGIGHQTIGFSIADVDWKKIRELASRQGLLAVVVDGIDKLPVDKRPEKDLILQWIGEVINDYERRYEMYRKAILELVGFYREHEIKMMLMKGYTCSLNWPKPNHRPCGDIDIWLFGRQEEADIILHKEKGIKIDTRKHHHTTFYWRGFLVENHFDFLSVNLRKSNIPIEKKLKEIVHKESKECDGIILPSIEFNAIYLLRHSATHFASTEMTIRQVLDWAFFMEKHYQEIDWNKYLPYIKQEGMFRFYNLMGLFCMRYLGFDASIFNGLYEDELFERFSNEILTPEFKDCENGKLLWSLWVKPRRWWHNRWKNRICYPDGAWSEFAYGLWAKILKPSHFLE